MLWSCFLAVKYKPVDTAPLTALNKIKKTLLEVGSVVGHSTGVFRTSK